MAMVKAVYFALLLLFSLVYPFPKHIEASPQLTTGIVINLPSRTLEYYQAGNLIKEYRVAIGSVRSPTPLGTFFITDKEINPWWYPPGKDYFVPSGPENPLGYRWIGFLPTYGIHGTNMPWSIGRAISNGCIRMLEEDVEELFELVDCCTPVEITYERIKVRIDKNGNASMGVYPDVYGYKSVSVESAQEILAKKGLYDLADESFLAQIISAQTGQQVFLGQVYNLFVNGIQLNSYAILSDGDFYVPATAIANAINTKVIWDDVCQTLSRQHKTVPGKLKGNNVYVKLSHFSILFGGKQTWQDFGRSLYLTIPMLFYNNQPISSEVYTTATRRLIPALTVANALGLRLSYDEQTGILKNSIRKIPVEIINGQPFIDTAILGEYYNAAIVWDEKEQQLNLMAAPWDLDCSMYLDLMQDFWDY